MEESNPIRYTVQVNKKEDVNENTFALYSSHDLNQQIAGDFLLIEDGLWYIFELNNPGFPIIFMYEEYDNGTSIIPNLKLVYENEAPLEQTTVKFNTREGSLMFPDHLLKYLEEKKEIEISVCCNDKIGMSFRLKILATDLHQRSKKDIDLKKRKSTRKIGTGDDDYESCKNYPSTCSLKICNVQ